MLAFDRRESRVPGVGRKMLVSNNEIDTCLTRLTWDFQRFLAVTHASGVWHVSHELGLTSECAIYACHMPTRWDDAFSSVR